MSMNDWFSYQAKKQGLDKTKETTPAPIPVEVHHVDDRAQMHVEETNPSDTIIEKMFGKKKTGGE